MDAGGAAGRHMGGSDTGTVAGTFANWANAGGAGGVAGGWTVGGTVTGGAPLDFHVWYRHAWMLPW